MDPDERKLEHEYNKNELEKSYKNQGRQIFDMMNSYNANPTQGGGRHKQGQYQGGRGKHYRKKNHQYM
jgi:hypothetical protein